jgi:magnesium transporter
MKRILTFSEIKNLFLRKKNAEILSWLTSEHPRTIADQLATVSTKEMWGLLSLAPKPLQGEIFSHFDEDVQVRHIVALSKIHAATILSQMPHDDRAKLFRLLTEEQKNTLYPVLTEAERDDIYRLSSYPPGTAGAVATSDYLSFLETMTVAQALEQIRNEAPSKETIYYSYVVNLQNQLKGFISLKKLILSDPKTVLKTIMHEDVIFAKVFEDQEKAAIKIKKYDLLALPVVNGENTLIGIITHDDAMDVIAQEQQEDIEKLMAIQGRHKAGAYLKTPFMEHYKNRIGWILLLALFGIISGAVIQSFESVLSQFLILALYMPMLADTGGNIGSQSATVIIQALAVGEIQTRDFLKVVWKEFRVSILLAFSLIVFTWLRVRFFSGGMPLPENISLERIGGVIALALGLQVISSTLIGTLLPLLVSKFNKDPAVIASPALTTFVDITGLIIYFGLAKWLLRV